MNNDSKVETAIAGLNCWASYATVTRNTNTQTKSQNTANQHEIYQGYK